VRKWLQKLGAAIWAKTRGLRGRALAQLHAHIVLALADDFRQVAMRAERLAAEQSERLSSQIAAVRARYEEQHQEAMGEMNLFTEGLVREIVRLQAQLEAMMPPSADDEPLAEPAANQIKLAELEPFPPEYRDAA
jgi:hypothetical protein